MMHLEDVIRLLDLFEQNSIEVFIDGGWGVDALLGIETRQHDDLDIAINRRFNRDLRNALENEGFSEMERGDSSEFMYIMADSNDRKVDVHVFDFDEDKNHIYGIKYPYESFAGTGKIASREVKCISPEWVVKFHTGYQLKQKDIEDITKICQKFEIELPTDYRAAID